MLSKGVKENHPFVKDDDENLLIHIGAAKRDNNGVVRPTKAWLLIFGNFYDITMFTLTTF